MSPDIRSVGIIGHGHFGNLLQTLVRRFAPQAEIRMFSRKHAPDGKDFFSLDETAGCDIVFLAVPIHAIEATLKKIVPLLSEKGVLIDISTVKKYPIELLKKYAKGKRYIATHPMWGPETYKKRGGDISGLRIIVTDFTVPEKDVEDACSSLGKLGFEVIRMTADKHDKHLADTLFLTHFIGQIVSQAKFDRTEIDTISFGYLLDAVESVKHDQKLFQDVFKYNPYCRKVLKKFGAAERKVQKLLQKR